MTTLFLLVSWGTGRGCRREPAKERAEASELGFTPRPLSSPFLGVSYRILNINHISGIRVWGPLCGHMIHPVDGFRDGDGEVCGPGGAKQPPSLSWRSGLWCFSFLLHSARKCVCNSSRMHSLMSCPFPAFSCQYRKKGHSHWSINANISGMISNITEAAPATAIRSTQSIRLGPSSNGAGRTYLSASS